MVFVGVASLVGTSAGASDSAVTSEVPANRVSDVLTQLRKDQAALSAWQASLASSQQRITSLQSAFEALRAKAIDASRTAQSESQSATSSVVSAYVSASSGAQLSTSWLSSSTSLEQSQAAGVYEQLAVDNQVRVVAEANAAHDAASAASVAAQDALRTEMVAGLRLLERQTELEAAVVHDAAALVAAGGASEVLDNSSVDFVSILGSSILSATQLAGWYRDQGYHDRAGASAFDLARYYVDEGQAEGVRGDVAFFQAVLETGGFSVMSGSNNFAGIGACDHCQGGYDYPSVQMGVRAQIELLHAYADATYSSKKAARALAYHGLDTLGVRGCCVAWTDLDGVWASGGRYGERILDLYLDALRWALSHPETLVSARTVVTGTK